MQVKKQHILFLVFIIILALFLFIGCGKKNDIKEEDFNSDNENNEKTEKNTETIVSVVEKETEYIETKPPIRMGAIETEYKEDDFEDMKSIEFLNGLKNNSNVITFDKGIYSIKETVKIGNEYSGCTISLSEIILKADILIEGDNITVCDLILTGNIEIIGKSCIVTGCTINGQIKSDDSQNLLISKNIINGKILLNNAKNAVVLKNNIGSIIFYNGRNLTASFNKISEDISVNGVSFALITDNDITNEVKNTNSKEVYGSNIKGLLANTEYCGADESLLPVNDLTRFEDMEKQSGIKMDGKIIDVGSYIKKCAKNSSEVIIPPGVYAADALDMTGYSGVSIYAYGALFIFNDYTKNSFYWNNCQSSSLRGLTIDFAEVPNGQGIVVSCDGDTVVWKPDEGYNFDLTDATRFAPDAAAEGFRAGSDIPYCDIYFSSERIKNNDGTFTLKGNPGTLKTGDKLTFRGLFAHVNYVQYSSDIVYEDVTIWGGSGFGFCEYYSEGGSVLNRVMMIPGPAPAGAAEKRMLSVCDATHSTNIRRGIKVTNSRFVHMTDDVTNINGTYSLIEDYDSEKSIVTYDPKTIPEFKKGDRIWIMTLNGKMLLDTFALSDSSGGKVKIEGSFDDKRQSTLMIENVSVNGAGFLFENCVVGYNRSRGLLIKSNNGTLKNNTVINCGMSGIILKPEISDNWGECGYTENINVISNKVVGCGYFNDNIDFFAPITVSSDGAATSEEAFQSHRNISVLKNMIEGSKTKYAMYINCAYNIKIEDNKIMCGDVYITGSTGVTISGNTGNEGAAVIRTDNKVKDISGSDKITK